MNDFGYFYAIYADNSCMQTILYVRISYTADKVEAIHTKPSTTMTAQRQTKIDKKTRKRRMSTTPNKKISKI